MGYKKRIIPFWWKFSGVAALLIVGALLYSTFTDEKFNAKPEINPDSNSVVLENQKDNGIKCAQKLGVPYRIYVDDGISGTTDDSIRGGLSDLFRDISDY